MLAEQVFYGAATFNDIVETLFTALRHAFAGSPHSHRCALIT
jgi:hypothetical protein